MGVVVGPRNRVRNIVALVEQVRERHLIANRPMRLRATYEVLRAEEIDVVLAPARAMRSDAYIDGGDGTFIITMKRGLEPAVRAKRLLHEYAHAKLHLTERGEVVRQLMPCVKGDVREDEAQLFAALLWYGPTVTPADGRIRPIVARLESHDMLGRRPPQYDFLLPETYDWAGHWRKVFALSGYVRRRPEELDAIAGSAPVAAWRKYETWPRETPEPVRPNEDFTRVELREGKSMIFTDVAGRKWLVTNYRHERVGDNADDERWWRKIESFASPEVTHRLFVSSAGERRMYRFKDLTRRLEARAYRVKHLDRQLAEAVKLAQRTPVRTGRGIPAGRRECANGDTE
jgi:hypothetical protein